MAENRTINDLAEIDIIPITITIGLVIHILSSIARVFYAKYEKWIWDTSIRKTYENKENSQTQTEEFRQESTTPLHDATEEERPKVIRNPILV